MDVRRRLATPQELRQGQEEMQKAQERMQSEAGRLDPIEDVTATEDTGEDRLRESKFYIPFQPQKRA